MIESLAMIGIIFLVFSMFTFSAFLKDGEQEGKKVARGAFLAIWVLIAFGVGSWAVSWLFMNILTLGEWAAETFHVNIVFLLFLPLIFIFVIGITKNLRKKGESK